MAEPSAGSPGARTRAEYQARINRVLDHIEAHLDGDLGVARLAASAHFSPFHFHRLFRAARGEPVGRFVQRLRVERAARRLLEDPTASVTAIALECGFSGSDSFARAFRQEYGMSATAWRSGPRAAR